MNCTCPLAGFCERHKVNKSDHWYKLCKTNDEYFQAWENGIGPGQTKDHPCVNRRVGTELKKLISWFPIPQGKKCKKCRTLEARMNVWGPNGCVIKKEFILRKLQIAAKRRKLPFSRRLVELLLNQAIRKAR